MPPCRKVYLNPEALYPYITQIISVYIYMKESVAIYFYIRIHAFQYKHASGGEEANMADRKQHIQKRF